MPAAQMKYEIAKAHHVNDNTRILHLIPTKLYTDL